MHSVIETPPFLAAARNEGIDDAERESIVSYFASHPSAGEVIPGTGGARKVRIAGRSKGKSGGYRVVTFYAADDMPVFLLTVYGKGRRANLSKSERNALRELLTALPREWRAERIARLEKRRRER